MSETTPAHAIFGFAAALSQPEASTDTLLAALATVAAPSVALTRLGFGAHRGQVMESFTGLPALAAWIQRAPNGTRFTVSSLVEGPAPTGEGIARYTVDVAGFVGGGEWAFTVGEGGLLLSVIHRPDELVFANVAAYVQQVAGAQASLPPPESWSVQEERCQDPACLDTHLHTTHLPE